MSKIYRESFTRQNANKSIDLDKLDQNRQAKETLEEGGMTVDQLRSADTNRDGQIDAGEAWKVADDFDRDGTRRSLIDVDAAGRETPAGEAVGALGLLLQNREVQGEARVRPQREAPANDDVLFVGLNNETRMSAGAKHEIQQMRNRGVNVEAVTDSRAGDDKVRVGGRTYDLTSDSGRLGFAQTLGLPADQTQKIADAIGEGAGDGKDELAQIAQVWARAERGERMPSRMVISGHNVGDGPWGDGNGDLTWSSLTALAKAMPTAAGRVEDLHIAACYSGGANDRKIYTEMFPKLKTIWAYSGSAPGAGSGATVHEASWEQATRGRATNVAGAADSLKRRGIRKANNIDAAAVTDAERPGGPSIETMRAQVQQGNQLFQSYFTGQTTVRDRQNGPLRQHYNDVQAMLQHPDLTPTERRELQGRRDQTIRTLFYDSHIRHRFRDTYSSQINAGYRALGMTAPDFGSMSRAESMEAIREFRQRVEGERRPPRAAQELQQLLNGLWNLSNDVVPQNWI